jgi:hypothetical protein
LGGSAKKSVEGYLLMPTDDSFQEAMNLIDSRFGDSFAVAFAFKSKIEQWPKIANRDAEGLRNFSDFLKQCLVAARTNPSLRVLDDDTQNRVMLSKIPDWLVSRWARQVNKSREQTNMYPSFAEFVEFLSREANIACDPVTRLNVKVDNVKNATQHQGSTLSTVQEQCTFCQNTNHCLEKCFKFRDKTPQEKEAFIKQKGICFGCLTPGHMSKTCKRRLQCKTCGKYHPTILHNDTGVKASAEGKPPEQAKNDNETGNGSKQSSFAGKHVSLMTNDAYVSKSTMVIPVYISHQMHPENEILTYALLDTQSDTSFISEFVVSQLGVSGSETTLLLSTMTSENFPIKCKRISGLKVRGHDCSIEIPLPTVFSRDQIPSGLDNIPTPQLADRWPYLRPMIGNLMPKSNCGIGLLIGYNCPRALVPRDIIPPEGNGPFAQKTDLGWGVVGLIGGDENAAHDSCFSHICSLDSGSRIALRTSSREVISPQENLGFFRSEEGYNDTKGQSIEDGKFLKSPRRCLGEVFRSDRSVRLGNYCKICLVLMVISLIMLVLQTSMFETANIVNSHPLTATNDPTSPRPITPNMLLTMKSNIVLPPPGNLTSADLFNKKRWRRVQHLANTFWDRWRKEYVHRLQERQKWNRPQRNLHVGDIVLAMDEALPRCQWKLGRISEVFPGTDGLVRRVKFVQGDPSLSNAGKRVNKLKVFERPVHKLILLVENEP